MWELEGEQLRLKDRFVFFQRQGQLVEKKAISREKKTELERGGGGGN